MSSSAAAAAATARLSLRIILLKLTSDQNVAWPPTRFGRQRTRSQTAKQPTTATRTEQNWPTSPVSRHDAGRDTARILLR